VVKKELSKLQSLREVIQQLHREELMDVHLLRIFFGHQDVVVPRTNLSQSPHL
jgi:hypothetical protein